MKSKKKKLDISNTLFLLLSPPSAFILFALYIYHHSFHLADFFIFSMMYFLTGMSITAGYHRYFSHKTYECHPILQAIYLFFGAGALQNSVLEWASDHRVHHSFVDKEKDPYNAKKGFFWSHMGWIFFKDSKGLNFESIPDLEKNKLVIFQHKYYLTIAVLSGFFFPFLLGITYDRPFGALLFGGLLRSVFVHHSTFLINSAAHFFGKQTYSEKHSGKDNWFLAFFTFGEGYHNFHHTFPGDYRNGIKGFHFDPSKWLIKSLNFIGLTSKLRKTPEHLIHKAKMRMDFHRIKEKMEFFPEEMKKEMGEKMKFAREKIELALKEMNQIKLKYENLKKEAQNFAISDKKILLKEFKKSFKDKREQFDLALLEYKNLLNEIDNSMRQLA